MASAAPDLFFAFPGDLATVSGGYGYDRRVIAELSAAGLGVEPVSLGPALPGADATALAEGGRRLASLRGKAPVVVDGLALGVLPEAAAAAARTRRLVALVHHPLAEETGLSRTARAALRASEAAALAVAAAVVVPSPHVADLLARDYAVPAARIAVAVPGVEPAAPAAPSADPPHRLLAVGALVPRKGYDVLLDALARLPHRDVRLTIAGNAERDRATAAALAEARRTLGLEARVAFAGEVDAAALEALWRGADLFVTASRFEGYGMVVSEALARGLPVVGTDGGALARTIPPVAGRIVPAGDPAALAAAIDGILEPAAFREAAAEAARLAGRLPRWSDTAGVFRRIVLDGKEREPCAASTSTG